MANRWYVALDGDELGPMSDTGLERMIQGGRIEGDTLVRNGAESEWLPARDAEEILAARPARQRPGEAAIRAAILSKQAVSRPPAPPAKITPTPVARPPEAPAADAASTDTRQAEVLGGDVLPAPDDLPLPEKLRDEQPGESPGADSSASPSPAAPPQDEPATSGAALPSGAAFSRRLPFMLAAGAGSVLILAVSFFAGWFALRGFSKRPALAAQSNHSALDPQLAALRQQAEQLERELAEARQKLEGQAPQADAQPPSGEAPPAAADMPDRTDSDAQAPAGPPSADLAAERESVATLIATEEAFKDERERLRIYQAKARKNPDLAFESELDIAFEKHLAEADAAVANLDAKQLAIRRKEIEAAKESRYKEAGQLSADARSAAERIEIQTAIEMVTLCSLIGPPEEGPAHERFLRDLARAMPYHVHGVLDELSDSQLNRLIAEQRLPLIWPDQIADATVAEAARKSAVRLAPLCLGARQGGALAEQLEDIQNAVDLGKRRKLLFLFAANTPDKDGELTAAEVKPLVETFGIFRVDDLAPLIDAMPTERTLKLASDPAADFVIAVATGKSKPEYLRDLFEKCRQAAGDAWPADDRPHPLAGRWKGPAKWELLIDPPRDAIAFHGASPEAVLEQRLCKIGPDYVIAYEHRMIPVEHVDTDPFGHEKYNHNDRVDVDGDPASGQAIAFTYYSLGKGRNTLELRRRFMAASFVRDNANQTFWELISMPKEYREFRATYRRVKE